MATVQAKMQSIIDKANATTGKQDKDLTAATQSLVDGFGGGGGATEIVFNSSVPRSEKLFQNAVFSKGDYIISFTSDKNFEGVDTFNNAQIDGKLTVSFPEKFYTIGRAFSMFYFCTAKEISFNGKTIKQKQWSAMFSNAKVSVIDAVFDFSAATLFQKMFDKCKNLREVRISPMSCMLAVSFQDSPLLSPASIQSIIDGLAQVEATQTLTLHPTVKAKLTEAQITQITSKNWTLA